MPVFWGIFNLPYYALWGQVPNSMLTHHNCSSIGYWFKDWLLLLQWDLMLHKEQGQSWTAWIMQCTGMPDVSVRMGYVPGLCSAAVTNPPPMSGCPLSFNICVCVRVCVCVCVPCHFARDSAHWGHSGDGAATTLTQASCHAEYQVQWQTCTQ